MYFLSPDVEPYIEGCLLAAKSCKGAPASQKPHVFRPKFDLRQYLDHHLPRGYTLDFRGIPTMIRAP